MLTCRSAKSRCSQKATPPVLLLLSIQAHAPEPKPCIMHADNHIHRTNCGIVWRYIFLSIQAQAPEPKPYINLIFISATITKIVKRYMFVTRYMLVYQSWNNHPILQLVDCSSQVPAVAFVKLFWICDGMSATKVPLKETTGIHQTPIGTS